MLRLAGTSTLGWLPSRLITATTVSSAAAMAGCRHYSSYRNSNNAKEEEETMETKPATSKSKEASLSKSNGATNQPISHPFMPVINIPETEFAHNAFFSLYRPLLGLSSDDEKPFFHNQNQDGMMGDEQDDEEAFAQYMMDLRPFEPPSSSDAVNETYHVQQDQRPTISFSIEEEPIIPMENSLPMYHMPDGDDIIDYLTDVQEKMKAQHAQEENSMGRKRNHGNHSRKKNATGPKVDSSSKSEE